MHTLLFAAFDDQAPAQLAYDELQVKGFNAEDISIVAKQKPAVDEPSIAGGTVGGALSGATTGGIIGGLAGMLAGAGVLPGLTGFLIGGPIALALGLTGIAATAVSGAFTGAVAGGLVGGLMGLGLSQEDARYYDDVINRGGVLLAIPVHSANEESDVRQILTVHHAKQVKAVTLDERNERHKAYVAHTHAREKTASRAKAASRARGGSRRVATKER